MFKKIFNEAVEFIQTLTYAGAMFTVAYLFLFMPTEVQGSSMQPNLDTGQRLIAEKVSYKFSEPSRGDIVVLTSPRSADQLLVKRLIGLPGESIKVESGLVYINNQQLQEPYLEQDLATKSGSYLQEGVTRSLRQDEYLVMGDNREYSFDSREFGPVTKDQIQGRALYRFWPINDIKVF